MIAPEPWAFAAMIALLLATTGTWVAMGPIHHDCALCLYYAARQLDGARLYVDLIETNPPLIFWLTVPPAWIARLAGLEPAPVFIGYVIALAGVSLWLGHRLSGDLADSPGRRYLLVIVAFIALVPCASSLFGEREQLLAIFIWPYLLLVARRLAGLQTKPAVAIGAALFASGGLLLKPQFLVAAVALEAYRLANSRDWRSVIRPETMTIGALTIAYAIAILWMTPAYLETVVPLVRSTYSGLDASMSSFAFRPEIVWFLMAFILFVWGRWRGMAGDPLTDVLSIVSASSVAAYLLQRKGWSYQAYPVAAFTIIWFGASGLLSSGRSSGLRREYRWVAGIVAGIGFFGSAATMISAGHYQNPFGGQLEREIRRAEPRPQRIYVFAANVSAVFPLIVTEHLEWPSRFLWLWPLPAIVDAEPPLSDARSAELARVKAYLIDSVVEDLGRDPPDLVFVDRRRDKPYFHRRFDYLPFFLTDARFAAFWRQYEPAGTTADFSLYRRVGVKRVAP